MGVTGASGLTWTATQWRQQIRTGRQSAKQKGPWQHSGGGGGMVSRMESSVLGSTSSLHMQGDAKLASSIKIVCAFIFRGP